MGVDFYPLTYVALALVTSFASSWAGARTVIAFAVSPLVCVGRSFLEKGRVDPTALGSQLRFLHHRHSAALSHVFTRVEIARVRRKLKSSSSWRRSDKARDDMRLLPTWSRTFVGRRPRRGAFAPDQRAGSSTGALPRAPAPPPDARASHLHPPHAFGRGGGRASHCRAGHREQRRRRRAVFKLGEGAVGAAVEAAKLTTNPGSRFGPDMEGFATTAVRLRCGLSSPFPCWSGGIFARFSARTASSTAHLAQDRGGAPSRAAHRIFFARLRTSACSSRSRRRSASRRSSIAPRRSFSTALTPDAVMEVGLDAALRRSRLTTSQPSPSIKPEGSTPYREARNRRTRPRPPGPSLSRQCNSLTAMVVKNRHYLPYRGEFDAKQQVLFTKKAKIKGMESLLVSSPRRA